ncbi:MAG: RT0821/Lpp0805 family surface protein [Rickettsiales bacterium]
MNFGDNGVDKMKRLLIVSLALGLFACDTGDRDNKKALSTLLGLGAGGVIGWFGVGGGFGDKFIAASFLGAGGAIGGYYLAEKLLPQDRERMNSTAFRALEEAETGEAVAWGEPGKGAWGSFTPVRDFTGKDGSKCRDYVATINVDGESGQIEESACLMESGDWRSVEI